MLLVIVFLKRLFKVGIYFLNINNKIFVNEFYNY